MLITCYAKYQGTIMKSIGRVLRRTLKSEFGKRKIPLPEKLSFLANIPFYAVTECLSPGASTKQTRVEILPASLKKVSSSHDNFTKLRKQHEELEAAFEDAHFIFEEQEKYIDALQKANEQLMANLGEGPEAPKSAYNSYIQVAKEIGFISRGLPIQGGLPSLGKRS